jgi:type I restriction-modification system DNA methylase subunit
VAIKERASLLRETNKKKKEERNLEELRAKQAANTIVKFGTDQISLLERETGSEARDHKKAMMELNQLFPRWTYCAHEKSQLKMMQQNMTKEEKKEILQLEREANKITSLKYNADNGKYGEHFTRRSRVLVMVHARMFPFGTLNGYKISLL